MIIHRQLKLSDSNSFFLFGARGTGKTTLLKEAPFLKDALYIDLLNADQEEQYALRPTLLIEQAEALDEGQWIIIDEVQKLTKLLDHVHIILTKKDIRFALTGSSSRKLKRGGANLLAGRAFNFSLYPFTSVELGDRFDLMEALQWGTLPQVVSYQSEDDKKRFLRSYSQTYLKEEILLEQVIRNLTPFRLFLSIAAQMNTQIVNFSNIARDTGVDPKTVQNYYQILVDTNLGFFLEAHDRSVRKVQMQSPKFYLFDMGVKRSLQKTLNVPLTPRTSDFGDAFESWFICECFRLNHYHETDFTFSYLRTKDDVEVDLIIERPGRSPILLEIKSAERIDERHVKNLIRFQPDFSGAEFICVSRITHPQVIKGISVVPWQEALAYIFGGG
ncbi:MAG: AAA family ATPase [Spirochaetaceae bacterium]|nr:AAA family ATPase [Spirochaetaceae bacterium]